MHRFGRCFQHLLRDDMYFVTLKTVRTSLCSLQHTIRKIVLKFLQSANNRTQSLREMQCMVVIGTVINTILGWLSVDPFGICCPSWDDAFVSSSGFGLPHCGTACRRAETLSVINAACADINHMVIDKPVAELKLIRYQRMARWTHPLRNTCRLRHFICFLFRQVPRKLCCAPVHQLS